MGRKRFKYKNLKNKSKAVRFLILFITGAVLSGAGAVLAQYTWKNVFGWKETVYREEHSLPLKEYLDISITNVPLFVETYDGDEILIYYVNETALLIEENEFSYKISQDADFTLSFFSTDIFDYYMRILLPNERYREISLSTASGDIEFSGIETGYLEVSGRSGSINLNGVSGEVVLKTMYGNITADFADYTDECVVKSVSGDVTVIMPRAGEVWLEFLTESGLFTSDFFRKDYSEHEGNIFLAIGDYPKKFSVETVSGNLFFQIRN